MPNNGILQSLQDKTTEVQETNYSKQAQPENEWYWK